MIIEKLQDKSGFTESEKCIADYILEHKNQVQQLTAKELAKNTLTSKSSIVRLCKKLGISGYQELKKHIFAEIVTAGKETKDSIFLIDNKSSYSEYLQSLDFMYQFVIDKMNSQLNHNVIKRIMNRLNKMERIDFYSSGLGHSIGEATAHKYSALGIESMAYSSINEAFWATNKNNQKTAAFVISLSGKNPSVIHIAKSLKHYGIYVIGIVGYSSKEMKEHCDEVVSMIDGKIPTGMEHMAIVLSLNYILDLIFMSLYAQRYDKQIELYKKVNKAFEK